MVLKEYFKIAIYPILRNAIYRKHGLTQTNQNWGENKYQDYELWED